MPRTPGAPRSPLAQLSPGNRNRIIGARAYGIPFSIIADQENCSPSGAYATVKNAALRAGQFVPSAYAASLHLLHIVKLSSQLINDELVSP